MNKIYLTCLFAFLLVHGLLYGQTTTIGTYSAGDISSDHFTGTVPISLNSNCPGILNVSVPVGRYVTSVDVEYQFQASGSDWISEQSSYLECVTTSTKEASVTPGPSINSTGTQTYTRTGLNIANGVVPAGGLQFKLHAFRSFTGGGCSVNVQKVLNNSFKVTVHHVAAPSCLPPSAVSVSSISANSANISWTTGGATNWQIEYGPAGFTPGTGTILPVSSNPYTLNSLNPSTRYEFRLRDSCGVADVSFWTGMQSFRTNCSTISAPWSEDFESVDWNRGPGFFGRGTIDTCFSRDYQGHFLMKVGPPQFVSPLTGPSGDHTSGNGKYVFSERISFGTFPDTAQIITPQIDLSNLTVPELTFWYHMFGFDVNLLEVFVSTNGGASFTSVFSKTGQQQTATADPWKEATVSLSGYANSTVMLKFISYQISAGVSGDVSIDDLSIHEAPPCPKPQNLVLLGTTTTSASLSWQSGGASNWQIEYGAPGFTLGTGTKINANSNPFVVKGLSANTSYEFYVRDSCNATDVSAWVGPVAATTDCWPTSAPYTESFNGVQWTVGTFTVPGNMRPCWYRDETVNYQMTPMTTITTTTTGPLVDHTNGTGKFLAAQRFFGTLTQSQVGVVESRLIDLAALNVPELSFWYHMFGADIDSLRLDIYDGQIWHREGGLSGQQQTSKNASWEEYIVNMSSYANDTVKLRFTYYRNSTFAFNSAICIDDIDIHEQPSCPKPQNLTVLGLTNSTASLQWTTGGASNWHIEYGPVGFTPGTGNLVTANANPFVITGLTANTTYEFYVRDSCGVADLSAWTGPVSGTTDCNPVPAPYTETFNGTQWTIGTLTVPGNMRPCWYRDETVNYQMTPMNTITSFSTGPNADHTTGSGKFLAAQRFFGTLTPSAEGVVESRLIDLSPLNIPELTFWYHMFGADIDSLRVDIFDGQNWNREGAIVGQQQAAKTDPWEEYLINMSGYANDTVKLRFTYYRNSTFAFNSAISIDDIDIHEQPTCPKPTNFTITSTSANSVTLSWTSGGANNWNIEYGAPGFAIGTGTRLTATTNPFTVTGLNSSTNYDFYVRDSCSATDTSFWVGPANTTTDCLPVLAPFSENFEGSPWVVGPNFNDTGSISQCWSRTPLVDYFWKPGPTIFVTPQTGPAADHTTGNGKFLFAESIFGGGTPPFDAYVESPLIDLSALTVPELSFWYHMFGNDIGELLVEIDNGTGYTQVWSKTGQQQTSGTDAWKEAIINLASYANDTIQIRFKANKAGFNTLADVAIDDVDIHEAPSCPKPQDLIVVGTTNSSITLQWTSGGASDWNIEYGAPGFSPGTGTIVNATSNPFTVPGLSANTGYEFYVRDSCGLGDVSDWVGPVGDTTDCNPVSTPYLETFDGAVWTVPASTFIVGNLDPCWSRDNSVNYVWGARQNVNLVTSGPSVDHTSGTGKFLYTHRTFGTSIQSDNGAVVSPLINTVPLNTPELSFWYHLFGADIDSLVLEVFDGNSWNREFALAGQQQISKVDAWKEAIVDISAYANDTIKVRFTGYRNSTFAFNSAIAIDDLSVHEQPSCPKPANLAVMGATANSITLGWTSGGANDWQIEYGPSGFTPGSGTIVAANTNPFTVTPLSSSTTYDFYVRDSCSANDVSDWLGPITKSTDCLPVLAPFSENFDGVVWQSGPNFNDTGSIDQCWVRTPLVDYLWRPGPPPFVSNFTGPSGDHTTGNGKYVFAESIFGGGTAPFNALLETPPVDLSSLTAPELRFWYHMFGTGIGSMTIEIDNGSGFSQVWSKTGQQHFSGSAAWTEAIVSLSSYANDTIVVRIKATKSSFSTAADAAIDDLSIDEDPNACPDPSNLTFTLVDYSEFTVNWVGTGTTTVEVVESGQPQGSGTFYPNATSPLLITGLQSNTSYDVYIQDSCGVGLLSQWVSGSQTTLVCPPINAAFSNVNTWLSVGFNSAATTNADSIYWDFGDGSNSSVNNPTYGYAAPGKYTVSMSAFSDCGDTAVVFDTIQVCDTLWADFSQTPIADSIKFDATISGNAVGYIWNIDGTDTTGASITFKFNSSGNKVVKLTAYNDCGDSVTVTKNVNACPPPLASWTYNIISTTGAGMKVQFDGSNSTNATSYDWDFGDGNTGTGPTPQHTYVVPSLNYLVRLTVKNSCGNPHAKAFKLNQIGLVELDTDSGIQIYPNPADEFLTLVWKPEGLLMKEILLIDITGKMVNQYVVNPSEQGELKVNVEQYAPGTYFLKAIGTKGEFIIRKVSIE